MGDPEFIGGNHEDYSLILEPDKRKRKRKRIIQQRNKQHAVWGVKAPWHNRYAGEGVTFPRA